MKASVIHEFGDVDMLKYEEIEMLRPGAGYALIGKTGSTPIILQESTELSR